MRTTTVRSRHKQIAGFLLAVLGGAWTSPASGAGPVAAAPPTSPSKVLAEIAGRKGNFHFPGAHQRHQPPPSDRSLAPYLIAVGEGAGSGTERLPLRETSADVSIAGVIARVQVHQVFENSGRTPIEAVYVFPASTRAAVHGVRMKIGNRTIEARIDRRQAARDSYETARREGRRASLLEQERPNVFTMNVANIMPGDRIAVEMDYSEMLIPEDATYELVYPTVVGPRYPGGADAKDHSDWISNPHLPAGTPEPYRFDIRVNMDTGVPIKELSSPSHKIDVSYVSATRAAVRLGAPGGGNRDFVLRYRLAGEKIESGVLLWEGEGAGGRREGFFAVMMEPPVRPAAAMIPPREYIFLLDVSGSMHGFPLDTAKALMRSLLGRLRPTDLFNVVLFSGAAQVLSPQGSMPARPSEIANAIANIERQRGGGGTELMGGLEMAYRIPQPESAKARGISRTVVVVTDGYVGVEAQAFRFIRERLSEANLFAFGIGSSVNRGLIEGMARAGQGEPFVVLRPEVASAAADKLGRYIEQPVMTGVKAVFSGLDAYDVAPGKLPDLMARRPLVLFGKYRGRAEGRIEIVGMSGNGHVRQRLDVRPSDVRSENAALRWLWARRWVETLDDERAMGAGKPAEEAITSIGLDYRLLTAFTSFVAIDSQIVNAGGKGQNVRQPLPMPDGVSNLAVEASAAPASAPMGALAPVRKMKMAESPLEGLGGGAGSGRSSRSAAAPAKGVVADFLAADKAEEREEAKPRRRLALQVVSTTAVGDTGPLVAALKGALAAGRTCGAGRQLRLRLTVDAHGKVVRVEVVGADRAAEDCWRKLLTGVSSATAARGSATGTVEVMIGS